ncbi:DNA-binding domain-containing protein [Rhodalgimonas zhirmunskyi]|uniref:DNA-binding domain-containing protein n=1 Tax=Rhodalgimonas zhirmunskyi TaxID=2964767 RepID=A0AAJ1U5I9_9RHOB|nr:DNA-binding domain-containing protein [Rhodoalgimonas zhirmunskyi]MDQ2093419.1 DNA-binding domain-containing protein [Rhodoalgimonas zhirmunskyi]
MSAHHLSDQALFAEGLFSPELPTAETLALRDGRGHPAGRRFSVYRNNVASSLTEALEQTFPTVLKLLGEENFRAIAGIFLRREPPRSPILARYGAGFGNFLDEFEPLAHLPYLGDVARLDRALVTAYHAADATPLRAEDLAAIPPDDLPALRLALAPACQVLVSRWPLFGIWQFNQSDDAPQPPGVAQSVLVTRPEFDPIARLLPPGGAAFLAALDKGQPLGVAADTAAEADPDFDLPALLGQLLSDGALLHAPPEETP